MITLGLDVGTSSVKAILVGEDGAVAAEASAPLAISRPHAGWSEQDPNDWWTASCAAIQLLPAALRSRVRAIGLAGQMHGAVLLDAADRPLRPAILWNDGRSSAECAELEAIEPASRHITGNIAMPGFTAPKILWVRRHEREIYDRVATVLLPKDYIRLKLTGDRASDMSDSAGTLWLDTGARSWSPAMLDACGLVTRHMPLLYEGDQPTGRLLANVAAILGLKAGTMVAAGGSDNAAGAIGAGIIAPAEAMLSLGTSGVTFVASDRFAPNPDGAVHTFCHALPGRWHQMAVALSAASCVDWVARLAGFGDVAAALTAAEARDQNAARPLFLPYLSGERTPHNDPHVRGLFAGLDHDTNPADLVQAVLEGVAFALADGQDAIVAGGSPIGACSIIGGGARSIFWTRILATACRRPLFVRDGAHVGPAFGAARLARLAMTQEAIADVCVMPAIQAVAEPNPNSDLAERQIRFRQLYTSLKAANPRQGDL